MAPWTGIFDSKTDLLLTVLGIAAFAYVFGSAIEAGSSRRVFFLLALTVGLLFVLGSTGEDNDIVRMNCHSCGARNDESDVRCDYCRAPLE